MSLTKIVEACQFLLKNYPLASSCKDYLNSRLNTESQEIFQFGYMPDINDVSVLLSLVDKQVLQDNKLFYTKTIEDSLGPRTIHINYFDNYPLILPFKDCYGEVVALVGRCLISEEERKSKGISKYKNTMFTKGNHLFGLFENKSEIIKHNMVYVVEGQFDVIKAVESGFKNIVALGNSNMTTYQFSLLTRYTDNIILLLDNDEAGEKGRKKTIEKFGKFANIQNFYLPENYKDIDEFLSNNSYSDLSFTIR